MVHSSYGDSFSVPTPKLITASTACALQERNASRRSSCPSWSHPSSPNPAPDKYPSRDQDIQIQCKTWYVERKRFCSISHGLGTELPATELAALAMTIEKGVIFANCPCQWLKIVITQKTKFRLPPLAPLVALKVHSDLWPCAHAPPPQKKTTK